MRCTILKIFPFSLRRVPLLISHPLSPFNGQHYSYPVELIDIFPTMNDLLHIQGIDPKKICTSGTICHTLQGKSLAPIILGSNWKERLNAKETSTKSKSTSRRLRNAGEEDYGGSRGEENVLNVSRLLLSSRASLQMPILDQTFAITQNWRCAIKQLVIDEEASKTAAGNQKYTRKNIWHDCDKTVNPPDEISVMGYSLRTTEYRYSAWFHFNRAQAMPIFDVAPFAEELYDHRGETLADFTHQEIVNLANKIGYESILKKLREQLVHFLRKKVVYRGPFK